MTPTVTVTVATSRLRYALLELMAVYDRLAADAWMVSRPPDVRAMREHKVRAATVGALLNEIGWEVKEPALPFELDLARHGWAAISGLEQLIDRERDAQWMCAALGEEEPEAAGVAAAHRAHAEDELRLIQAACERAGLTIAEPEP